VTKYLDEEDILRLHKTIASRAIDKGLGGGPYGIKDRGAFESAVFRPRQTLFDKDAFPTLFLKAAALARSLARNHAFHNGNKRTALLAMVAFLRYNGYEFGLSDREAGTIATKFQIVAQNLADSASTPDTQRKILQHFYLLSIKEHLDELKTPKAISE
jgi:death on curing protein